MVMSGEGSVGAVRDEEELDVHYQVDEIPPWYLTIFFGIQQTLSSLSGCVFFAVMTSQLICADQDFSSSLFATTTVLAGLATALQALVGVRLPVFQGPSYIFFIPLMNAAKDPDWGCRNNNTFIDVNNTLAGVDKPWLVEWSKMQIPLMIGAGVETLIGVTGLIGLLNSLIRPITTGVIFILLGFFLWQAVANAAKIHWGIAAFNIVLIIILSQYINKVRVPVPVWQKSGIKITWLPLFQLFPILIMLLVGWLFAYILTVSGALNEHPKAKTDIYAENIDQAPWFRFPYPGQYGDLSFRLRYLGYFVPLMLISALESIADYRQYSLSCCVPQPPSHAVNRGIMIEGAASIVSAVLSAGHATTSYSGVVGQIRITKVASRAVCVTTGLFIACLGIFGKIGSVLVAIPSPVLAGSAFIGISMLSGTAFANFADVNLRSGRSHAIIGISLITGIVSQLWIQGTPGALDTGYPIVDSILESTLGLGFLVGGVVSIFLDHTMPGSSALRTQDMELVVGSEQFYKIAEERKAARQRLRIYYPPFFLLLSRRITSLKYWPIFPNPDKDGLWEDDGDAKLTTEDVGFHNVIRNNFVETVSKSVNEQDSRRETRF